LERNALQSKRKIGWVTVPMANRVNISLDDTAETLWDKLENEVNKTYDGGRSGFFRDMLMKYADDKTRLEARKEMIEDRIENHKDQIDELKMQKRGVEDKIEEMSVEEEEEQKIRNPAEDEFWEDMADKVLEGRKTKSDDPMKVKFNKRFPAWHRRYKNNYGTMPVETFREKFLSKAKELGYEDKVEKVK